MIKDKNITNNNKDSHSVQGELPDVELASMINSETLNEIDNKSLMRVVCIW